MRFLGLVAAVSILAGASTAGAVTVDFTKTDDFGVAASGATTSGTWDGVGLTLNAIPVTNNLTHATNGWGDRAGDLAGCQLTSLACAVDGIGINDDEVTAPRSGELLEVVLDTIATVTGIHLLDLYSGTDKEQATVAFLDALGATLGSVVVTADGSNASGYGFQGVYFEGVKSMLFAATCGPDSTCRDDSSNDFALAAIDMVPVPLPAAGWMLLVGLGGIAAMKRRKKA